MKNLIKVTIASLFILGVTACSNTQPINNVQQSPVVHNASKEQVRSAIIEAATNRGWLVEEVGEAEIAASINVRSHQASIRIPYTDESYSILYDSSLNLKQRGNQIHRNYNRWVLNLRSDIDRQLQMNLLSN